MNLDFYEQQADIIMSCWALHGVNEGSEMVGFNVFPPRTKISILRSVGQALSQLVHQYSIW